jgi:hypothetical protein
MAPWSLLRSDRKARAEWDAGLRWFRLRYEDAADPRRAIELLSGRPAAGRVALVFLPGTEVSRLYVGIPERHTATWQRLARDFAFSVRREEPMVAQQVMPLAPVANLPWERAFVAHVVENCAFIDTPEEPGRYLPRPGMAAMSSWQLPADPPAGLALRPTWNGHLSVPPSFTTGETGRRGWPLGRSPDGTLFSVTGPVNVYGGQDAAAAWLVQLIAHLLDTDPAGLIVLDGAGDLVPVLKRKELVTRRLGQELAYVDIDSLAVGTGFNPLAPLSSETAAATLRRWQHWFEGMGVYPAGLQVLEAAQKAGVADIPGLERWLERPEQQHRPEATHRIQAVLKRLLADPHLREWLSWPTHPFAGLQPGALLFACTAGSWARHQVLTAARLAALQIPGARLVLHGLPWQEWPANEPSDLGRAMVTNGPLSPAATVLLAASEPPGSAILARRFLRESEWWQESLQLLDHGEGIILDNGAVTLASWKNGPTGRRIVVPADAESLRPAAGNGG